MKATPKFLAALCTLIVTLLQSDVNDILKKLIIVNNKKIKAVNINNRLFFEII